MKTSFAVLLFLSVSSAWSQTCKVYGISDSPQRLICTFDKQKVNLTCEKGHYLLDGKKIKQAFHYDVEHGPTPLVFQGPDLQLVVTIHSASRKMAQLETPDFTLSGTCR